MKKMKRMIALLLALVMLLGALTACGLGSPYGTYRAKSASYSGIEMTLDGNSNYIQLEKDGTYVLAMDVGDITGTYTGTYRVDGDTLYFDGTACTIKGNSILLEMSGVSIVYSK